MQRQSYGMRLRTMDMAVSASCFILSPGFSLITFVSLVANAVSGSPRCRGLGQVVVNGSPSMALDIIVTSSYGLLLPRRDDNAVSTRVGQVQAPFLTTSAIHVMVRNVAMASCTTEGSPSNVSRTRNISFPGSCEVTSVCRHSCTTTYLFSY